ncbi:hypothetical protein BJV78DRAFT_110006 [Lactifluus subvellereus]|nr:hypothetical protein BJV78DRAFT_110006 [Lactifluus subvellereus]
MESSPAPAPLPQSYDDRAVLQLEPLRDAFIARELGQRRMSKAQEREWVAGIAKDVRGNKSAVRSCSVLVSSCSTRAFILKAEVARRWLMAISASGKRAFWNFVLPLDDETFQLFVRFFWLIHTKDLSAAKKLLASSRRSWGLESYLYEFTVSKRLESVDGSTLSSAGVPNWVPYSGGAKSSNTPRSLVRKRSILRSTSFPISRRPMAVQSGLKKKRRLNGKTRLALRRTNSAGKRVRANKSKYR